jgi:hypothetical protein
MDQLGAVVRLHASHRSGRRDVRRQHLYRPLAR